MRRQPAVERTVVSSTGSDPADPVGTPSAPSGWPVAEGSAPADRTVVEHPAKNEKDHADYVVAGRIARLAWPRTWARPADPLTEHAGRLHHRIDQVQ